MSATRYASVLGLGFGDCGKGHFVDALTRLWGAHTVVRFNGGAQAGHNVVTSAHANAPARHHTFSQFGSGTLVPGVRTVLVDPMIVHPTALLVEAEALAGIGVADALSRLTIDARCRVTTPFHQAAGRLRERLRGAAAHGTCGVGVGETVRHALAHPALALRYAELQSAPAAATSALLERLQAIRESLLAELSPRHAEGGENAESAEWRMLRDESLAAKWAASARAVARHCPPASFEIIRQPLSRNGCILFEGAQGVLLDEWRGFHPHTTWSNISTAAAESVAARFGIEAPFEHYGVLRTYCTRHGAGPLPTHDEALDARLPEPHNGGQGWQGPFRRGHPDAVLLRYALEAAGRLSGLLISHLDVFQRGLSLNWSECYAVSPPLPPWLGEVERLPLGGDRDLLHQGALTRLLQNAQPQFGPNPINSASEFLDRLKGATSVPVVYGSYGPADADVRSM